MNRILALFSQRESRDELGIGAIRDSISDLLFPGTNTIMTRLRYLLFIPWVYRELEEAEVSSLEIGRRARKGETALVGPLDDQDESGILGRRARGDLKRLPSSVYWAGLVSWGIYRRNESQASYHRLFDKLKKGKGRRRERSEFEDGQHEALVTWHEDLPAPPSEFPEGLSFVLRREEASFLRDRISENHAGSLLAWLVNHGGPVPEAAFPWEHPHLAQMSSEHQELLEQARRFSEVMHGAALLYNRMLSELRGKGDDGHAAAFEEWARALRTQRRVSVLQGWDLKRFWELLRHSDHTITERARLFVTNWLAHVVAGTHDGASARELVRRREVELKKGQSRFSNGRALENWSGRSGLNRLDFRWSVTARLLGDLKRGLEARDATA